MRPLAWSSIFSIAVTPVSAALIVLMLWPIESLSCDKVVRAAVQPLRGEERDSAVDGRVDLVASGQPLLRAVDLLGRELQQQQVVADARSQLNVVRRHQGSPSYPANFGRALAPDFAPHMRCRTHKQLVVPDANYLNQRRLFMVAPFEAIPVRQGARGEAGNFVPVSGNAAHLNAGLLPILNEIAEEKVIYTAVWCIRPEIRGPPQERRSCRLVCCGRSRHQALQQALHRSSVREALLRCFGATGRSATTVAAAESGDAASGRQQRGADVPLQ